MLLTVAVAALAASPAEPAEPAPVPAAWQALDDPVAPEPAPAVKRPAVSTPMAVGAGVLLAAAGRMFLLADDARSEMEASDDLDELDRAMARTNRWLVGGWAAGSAGLALGVGAVVVARW